MAETNKSKMMSEAEIIEAINSDSLVSVSLGSGQPQKNVKLSTLASVVAGIMSDYKLFPFMLRGYLTTDANSLNTISSSGIYTVNNATNPGFSNLPSGSYYGVLVSFSGYSYYSFQLFANVSTGNLSYRKRDNNGWSSWATL